MKQPGLIYSVISAVGIGSGMAKGKYTSAGSLTLVNNEDGVPASGSFNYSSVVGILIYLYGNTIPKIDFAVNCCKRYMFFPKHSHEEALRQTGRYLKLTHDLGLILNPNMELLNIDSYPDQYFSGMYKNKKPTYTACDKSCTSYVITFLDFIIYGNKSCRQR